MNIAYTASLSNALADVNNSARLKTDMKSIGQTVQDLRHERGWTQEHLAELTDTSQRWISNLEGDNVRMPRLARLQRLGNALGVDPGILVRAAQYTQDVELGRELAEVASACDGDRGVPAEVREMEAQIRWTKQATASVVFHLIGIERAQRREAEATEPCGGQEAPEVPAVRDMPRERDT